MNTCPKCGKPFIKYGFLGEPDEQGICSIVIHSMKRVDGPFGSHDVIDERCFINIEQFNAMVGPPTLKCEDCVGCRNQGEFSKFCMKFNTRPNFREKKEEDDDGLNEQYDDYMKSYIDEYYKSRP